MYRKNADRTAYSIIQQKQEQALGKVEPFTIEQPSDTFRRRLMLQQDLLYSDPASLGTKGLEEPAHWPNDDYLKADENVQAATANLQEPVKLNLEEVLQIAATNSRQYQNQKESVFRSALDLDLQRDRYRNTFSGIFDGAASANLGGNQTTSGLESSAIGTISKQFLNGLSLSGRIGLDLVKLLNPFDEMSHGIYADTSVSMPLLRGAGRHIEGEPLTQAERNVVYAIYNFERYKRTFAVNVARDYFSVLQAIDQIKNSEENYRSLITSTRRARLWAEAGKVSPVDVDQSIQQELEARNRWIREKIGFERTMDSFKMMLGLPPDAQIELDRNEMDKISASVESIIQFETSKKPMEDVPDADAEITLRQPTNEGAGPYELDTLKAMKIALDNRLDFRAVRRQVEDAQREVVIAADGLRAELTLLGNSSWGEGRGLGSAGLPPHESLRLDKGNYNALLSLDLPIERTSEMMAYRRSIIGLEQAVRDFQDFEDTIKLNIRNKLRDMQEARQSLQIQAQAVELAKQRVESTNLSLEAGRAIIRDLLEAQQDLLSSQNSFTGEKIDYRLAELELQRDLGVLEVNEKGLWTELKPEELDNGSQ